nr:hypothetical protein [Microbacterium foliorum]
MADVGIAAVAPDFEHASMLCAEMCRFLLGSAAFGALPLVSPESLAQALSSIARTDSRLVEAAARVKGIAEASSIEDWTTEVIHGDFHRGNVHRSLAGEIVILDWSDSARMLVPPRSSATFGLTCQLMLQAKGLCDLFEATDVELARLHDPQHLELLKHSATQAVTTTLVRLGASDPVPSTVVR